MSKVLKSVKKKIAITLKDAHDPKEFFKDRPGLYVWGSFISNIVDKAKGKKKDTKYAVSSFELTKNANDAEIEENLPKKHLFSETDVCAIVADLIEKQPKGEEGSLLNNGYANLFYTSSRVVNVDWRGDRWHVGGWGRDDRTWDEGGRVFSPATEI